MPSGGTAMQGPALDPAVALRHVLAKQHLAPGSAGDDVVSLATDLIGLHSTSPLSPYLSSFSRLRSFRSEQLDRELYERRSLLRLPCMRGTVFVVPRELAPMMFTASRAATAAVDRRWLALEGDEYRRWAPRVVDALAGTTASAAELRARVGADQALTGVISMLCQEGRLVRDRPAGTRRSTAFRYRRFEDVFPDLDLHAIPESTAIQQLVHRYVSVYGPVTLHDVAWWSGLPVGLVRSAIAALGDALAAVSCADADEPLLMTTDDLSRATDDAGTGDGSVALLPVLDPFLMGYRERRRFLEPSLRRFVYDPGGNASFTVLVDGRVAGVWDLTEDHRPAVRVLLFDPTHPRRRAVLDRCADVGEFWFGHPVPVLEYVAMTPLSEGRSAMHPLDGASPR
jgi:hypothetical protein